MRQKLLPLDQVGGQGDLLRWYGEARVTFANLLGQPAPPKAANGPPPGATFGDLLSLAYASVVTSDTGVALSTAGEVADVLAEQERLQFLGQISPVWRPCSSAASWSAPGRPIGRGGHDLPVAF
jgi:hypothetical protein